MTGLDLLVLAVAAVLLAGLRPVKNPFDKPLSLERSRNLKGLCAVVVLLHHLAQRTGTSPVLHAFCYLGYLATAVFFFLTGYGLMKSHMNKVDYQRRFLANRLPALLLPAGLAAGGYAAFRVWSGEGFGMDTLLAHFMNGDTIVDNAWYVVVLAVFYLAFRLLMRGFGRNHLRILAGSLAWAAGWMVFCRVMHYGTYWYNTVLLLPAGMFWAVRQDDLYPAMKRHAMPLLAAALPAFALTFSAQVRFMNAFAEGLLPLMTAAASAVLLVFSLLLLGTKVKLTGRISGFLGGISYEMYLIHGLLLTLLRSQFIYLADEAVWCAAVLAVSVVTAWAFHKIDASALALIRRPAVVRIPAPATETVLEKAA